MKALGSLLGWYCIYLASIQCCIYWMTIIVVFCIEHLKKTENIVLQWLFLKLVYICIFVIFGVELKNLIWYMYEQLFFFISIQYSVKTLIRAMCRSREGGSKLPLGNSHLRNSFHYKSEKRLRTPLPVPAQTELSLGFNPFSPGNYFWKRVGMYTLACTSLLKSKMNF